MFGFLRRVLSTGEGSGDELAQLRREVNDLTDGLAQLATRFNRFQKSRAFGAGGQDDSQLLRELLQLKAKASPPPDDPFGLQ